MTKIKLRNADKRAAKMIFSHAQNHGTLPSYPQMAKKGKYTRQNAYENFQRLMALGVIEKTGRGEYILVNIALMPGLFKEIYDKTKNSFTKSVKSGNSKL